LIAGDAEIPEHLDQLTLWKIILNMVCEPPRRKKLPDINTLDNVVDLIRNSKKIIVLVTIFLNLFLFVSEAAAKQAVDIVEGILKG
jgi:hypothetical protein